MANFKTHLSVGVILGIICATVTLASGILSGWNILTLAVGLTAIGAILPDVDSDSAIPFKIVFYLLGITSAIFVLIWITNNYSTQWGFAPYLNLIKNNIIGPRNIIIIGLPLITFFAVRFILGAVFKKFTKHRGIFHSIPMALISMLITLTFLNLFSNLKEDTKLFLSLVMGVGYFSHLILDEIYAGINFNGKKFHPNKNLGAALKLWSSSFRITFLVYFIIFILFKLNF